MSFTLSRTMLLKCDGPDGAGCRRGSKPSRYAIGRKTPSAATLHSALEYQAVLESGILPHGGRHICLACFALTATEEAYKEFVKEVERIRAGKKHR